jgi:hypothetical protein
MDFFLFQDSFSITICLGLASNHDPPDLCILNSEDYRYEPLAPGLILFIFIYLFIYFFVAVVGLKTGPPAC